MESKSSEKWQQRPDSAQANWQSTETPDDLLLPLVSVTTNHLLQGLQGQLGRRVAGPQSSGRASEGEDGRLGTDE